ncbi:MAG: class I SAM-dependent methyltransferase [Solirubrobacterales bacterium]
MQEVTLRSPTELYEYGIDSLRLNMVPTDLYAVGDDGSRRLLPIDRWLQQAPDDEERLLDRASGPVLDIGCGPGRHLAALGRRGVEATGVEVSNVAVAIAREQNSVVIHGSVFDVDAAPEWHTALLLDGNIGIGGNPERLLSRATEFLRPGGQILVELEPPQSETRSVKIRLEGPSDVSEWFPWAWVGTDGIRPVAAMAGLTTVEVWTTGDRWFAQLAVPQA